MKRKAFVQGMGALLGTVVFGPVLTACGGGDEADAAASGGDDLLTAAARGRSTGTGTGSGSGTSTTPTTPPASLDANEVDGLRYMREEEKLAHDVYLALYARWPRLSVFGNIAASEAQHTDAVLGQLQRYGVADPAAGKAAGVFDSSYLQALYNQLVAMGSASEVEALKVGCLIEETDIQDIRDKMALTDEASILSVYQNLLCGSYNHLQSFNRVLANRGVAYQPQVISQDQWNAIASGSASCNA